MLTPHRLQQRSHLLQAVRSFFYSRGYFEVDTPIRLPVLIPEPHIIPFEADGWYLHTSPELCMKRLLARGNSKLFQVSHCFRKEEVGRFHQTEFTMLEWYQAGWSYEDLMAECESFICFLAEAEQNLDGVLNAFTLLRENSEISLAQPWDRITVDEAFRKFAGQTAHEALKDDMFDELLVTRIEPNLGWEKPVFLYDYPVECGSLARRKEGDESLAERFELYIAGLELANGFSELVEPDEQRRRFEREIEESRKAGHDHAAMPEKFLDALDHLGKTAGIALGLDRLFMIFQGLSTVSEVVCLYSDEL